MLDHISIHVKNIGIMAAYYERVLSTVGYRKGIEYPGGVQFVNDEDGDAVWLSPAKEGTAPDPSHFAWRAKDVHQVKAFYAAALEGGRDNGAPDRATTNPATTPASSTTPRATTSRPCSTGTKGDRRR